MSVKYPNYVNLTSSSKEQPNERTPSPPPRKKSLSPPQASSKIQNPSLAKVYTTHLHHHQATPKEIMGPPVITSGSEKNVSFQKSILGPRPKHIIVNNVKVPVASDDEVKQFYKPLSKPVVELDEWIKDSGCSKHMTGNQKLFSTYKAYNGGNVIFGSNLRGNVIGKGTISNDSLNIDNVEDVDNLRFNLLSVGQICDNKCKVTFSEHDSKITKDVKVVGRGIRKKGLYVMKLRNTPKDKICLATIDKNSSLWHRRLGHANMRLIQSLASKELVRNLLKLKFDQHFYDACKIGKQAHASYKAMNIVSMTRCLQLLHMDLFGLSDVRSYGGNRYTLVIVDDYSRPNIMFSVCLCAHFQEAHKTSHLEALKRIFRYIKGTTHLGLWYPKETDIETVVYADSDHAGDYVDRKSTSGICTFVGCCLRFWFSKKQTAVAISTTESEYVSAKKACQQALWMKQPLINYDV
nr:retrovirus-related Pol polyprotein from transposon TNT 1-94 [Tanacetum cinerariifolium]